MSEVRKDNRQNSGFTLVELAIVMIIIGLLIGGILKGQELIANARTTATIAQIKGIDAALTTFRDKFNGMPGDLLNPSVRLTNCTGAPCMPTAAATNGNNRIDTATFAAAQTGENLAAFPQLAAADLLSGLNPGGTSAWGTNFPAAPIGGGFEIAYATVLADTPATYAATARAGHYLVITSTAAALTSATTVAITPNQAFRIDNKLDDGAPTTGSVSGGGAAAGATSCLATGGLLYNEANNTNACMSYIRIQQ